MNLASTLVIAHVLLATPSAALRGGTPPADGRAIALFPVQDRAGDSGAPAAVDEALRNELGRLGRLVGPGETLDDIQFISGKERTQAEFFHTFNSLYEARKQIVVTSDKFPKDIPNFEERLRSRFEWGLIADIQAPDIETKVAILRKKAENENIPLPNDVAFLLASQIDSNIRVLEGSLIRIGAFASLTKTSITIDMTMEVLKNIIRPKEEMISIDSIQKIVSAFYNIKSSDLKVKRKYKGYAHRPVTEIRRESCNRRRRPLPVCRHS